MGRPRDWSPLDLADDPTPGDPAEVADLARRYRRTAQAVKKAAAGLKKLHGDTTYVGDGGDKLRARSKDLASNVEEIHERYDGAAKALAGYHPEHNAAQVEADAALSRAVQAKARIAAAERMLQEIGSGTTANGKPDPAAEAARARAVQMRTDAQNELTAAKTAAGNAANRQTTAGDTAARQLADVIKRDGLNDSWKDNVAGVASVVASWAGALAAVFGIAALLVGWIPIVGQALAAVFGAIALVLTVVSLLANLTLMISGKGSWKALALDVVSLATLGIGRALMASGKLASVAARGKAWIYLRNTMTGGTSASRSARRVQLLGGPLRQADRAVPFATRQGFRTTMVDQLRPTRYWADTMADARTAWASRSQFPTSVTEVRAAWRTFSGGSFQGAARAFATGSSTEFARLAAMDDALRNVDEIRRAINLASGFTYGVGASTATAAGVDAYQAVSGTREGLDAVFPEVDAPRVGVGRAQPGLPHDFEAPSRDLPPVASTP